MNTISTIAIDGPASSGKSTLGKILAERLGYLYFDTGVMYRAVACEALSRSIDVEDEGRVTDLAERLRIDVRPPSVADGRDNDLLADGKDITWDIRTPEVDGKVSLVSAYSGVRDALTVQQRRIGKRGRVVMVGRDIGTVVLPDADLKIYLDASAEERARRRHGERLGRGEAPDYEEILAAIVERDRIDSSREVAPLRPAEDAVVVMSDDLSVDQVVDMVLNLVSDPEQRTGSKSGAQAERR